MYCSNLTVTDENLNPYGLMHTSLQVPDMKCRSLFYNIATGSTKKASAADSGCFFHPKTAG